MPLSSSRSFNCGSHCSEPGLSYSLNVNSRFLRILAGLGAVLAVAYIVWKRQPEPAAPIPVVQTPATPAPASTEVAIQDGWTIDFSKGAAEIRSTPTDQAVIDAAMKEMLEATKSISFEAPAKATP